ncbi:MAG: S8 family serine peptidase [Acidobacteriota bacterium]
MRGVFVGCLSVFLFTLTFAAPQERFVDVVVSLNPDLAPGYHLGNQQAAAGIAHSLGISPRHVYGTALYGFAARVSEGRLEGLRRSPLIDSVSIDGKVSVPPRAAAPPWCRDNPDHPACSDDGGGDTTGQTIPWGVARIGADLNANEGAGIHVYVIDTGVDSDHRDLQANLGNGAAVQTCKGKGCNQSWDDDNGHGTHVAGTIGAIDNDVDVLGVASQVTLHAVKVLSKSGSGSFSGVIAGVDWVANETANRGQPSVANMSLGGGGSKSGTCTSSGFTGDDNLHKALCNAKNKGVVFVVAAGNNGTDAASSVPAAYDDAVITVSATNQGDDWPSWSNWGDGVAFWTSNVSAPVAIAAPGVDILSTWNDGKTNTTSGTSMATPHVAGTAALYLAGNSQAADGNAFSNTRSALLTTAESSDSFSNSSGNPHAEDFADATSQ